MESSKPEIDLDLWLNQDLIKRQNRLKSEFLTLLSEVGNSFPSEDLNDIHPLSKGKKISKGNDLGGFPYQVLDLIRDFEPKTCSNIRLLNWFGHGFFLMLLINPEKKVDGPSLLASNFKFALTESPWDYPELIVGNSKSDDLKLYASLTSDFRLWIKPISLTSSFESNQSLLQKEVKNLLEILQFSSKRKRN